MDRKLHDHGGSAPIPLEAAVADDPDLWLVFGDPVAWDQAHPCECEALCECDRNECDRNA